MNFQLFGMMRSGNHALVEWIANQLDGALYHHNDIDETNNIERNFDIYGDGEVKHHLYSYENIDPVKFMRRDLNPILIIRSPLNWLASLIKYGQTMQSIQEKVVMYLLHCTFQAGNGLVIVEYDKFFRDSSYRAETAELLNLEIENDNIETVGTRGGGSSFDKYEYQGRASEMKVLDRYNQLEPQEATLLQQVLLCYPQLLEIHNKSRNENENH